MILRLAAAQDAGAVAAIWNPVIRETAATFTTQEKTIAGLTADFAARAAEGKAFLLAEEAGQLLGFATYFQFRNGPGYAHTMEHTIVLAPAARGRVQHHPDCFMSRGLRPLRSQLRRSLIPEAAGSRAHFGEAPPSLA